MKHNLMKQNLMNNFTKTLKNKIYIDETVMGIFTSAMQKTVTKVIKF